MHSCRRPFQDCASLCDRCATPVYTIPPETEFLTTRFAMLCFAGAMFAVIALIAFMPGGFSRAEAQFQSDLRR